MTAVQGSDTYVKAAGTYIKTRTRRYIQTTTILLYLSDDAGSGRVIGSPSHVFRGTGQCQLKDCGNLILCYKVTLSVTRVVIYIYIYIYIYATSRKFHDRSRKTARRKIDMSVASNGGVFQSLS
jgi:hypothetical protein